MADPYRLAAQRQLSRTAAAELQGRAVPQGGWTTQSSGGNAAIQQAFQAFLSAYADGRGDEAVVTAALAAARWKGDPGHVERSAREWTRRAHQLERSPLRVLVGLAAEAWNGPWNEPARRIAEAYTVTRHGGRAALLVPRHVVRWGQEREVRYTDLGAATSEDTETVLEVLLGTSEGTHTRKALAAARSIAALGELPNE